MRWSFDRLAEKAISVVMEDPYSGHLFVFRNRRKDRVKILYWDEDGYAIWYKRLERGVFRYPELDGRRAEIERSSLVLLLEGIEVTDARIQKRYRRKKDAEL